MQHVAVGHSAFMFLFLYVFYFICATLRKHCTSIRKKL